MRRFDKKKNISKVNLLAEQRYLVSKGIITESFHDEFEKYDKIMYIGKPMTFNNGKTVKYGDVGKYIGTEGGEECWVSFDASGFATTFSNIKKIDENIDEMDYSRDIVLKDFNFLNKPEFNGWKVEDMGDGKFKITNQKYPYFEFIVSLDKGKYSNAGEYPWNYEAKHTGGINYPSSGHQGFRTIERNATSNLERTLLNFINSREEDMK